MVFFLSRRRPCLRSLDFYFFIVLSNFCFIKKISEVKFENYSKSVRILHRKMKAGAKIIPNQRFSNSNGIGLMFDSFSDFPPVSVKYSCIKAKLLNSSNSLDWNRIFFYQVLKEFCRPRGYKGCL